MFFTWNNLTVHRGNLGTQTDFKQYHHQLWILLMIIVLMIHINPFIQPTFATEKVEKTLSQSDKKAYAEAQLKVIMSPKQSAWMGADIFWNPKRSHRIGRTLPFYKEGKLDPSITYYEVLENTKPIGIVTLTGTTQETLSLQFSKSFSSALIGTTDTKWQVHLNHQILSLVSNGIKKKLYALPSQKAYVYEDLPMLKAMTPTFEKADVPKALPYMKRLSVPIVQQGPYPWCWAASFSALTQYKLKSKDILYQVTENDPTRQGDIVKTILPAFQQYGLSATVTGPMTLYEVKQSIIQGNPIYMLSQSATRGHATLICGYLTDKDTTFYLMMDPNRREYVICKATDVSTLYHLGGETFTWQYTIQY